MRKYLYAVPNSWPVGPLSLDELRRLKEQGKLTDRTLVAAQDSDNWQELGALLGTPPTSALRTPALPRLKLQDHFLGGAASWVVLSVGQLVSLVVCLAIILTTFQALYGLSVVERRLKQSRFANDPDMEKVLPQIGQSRVYLVLAAALAFCLSAALFVVFKRAKAVARVAAAQDGENQRLWQAIEALRNSAAARSDEDHS